MIRCCVIGNSHVAALKTGWDLIAAEHPQIRPTWFASRGMSLWELELRDRALHAQTLPVRQSLGFTSGGPDHIALDEYDAFVLCGLGLGVLPVLAVYATHCTMEHNASADGALVSTPCFDQAVATLVREGLLVTLARKIREVSAAPIIAVPTPMPASGVLRDKGARSRLWQRAVRHRDELALAEAFARVAAAHCAPCNAVALPPQAALKSPLISHTRYASGAARLLRGFEHTHAEGEFEHLNADYGRLVWGEVLALGAIPRPPGDGSAPVAAPVRAEATGPACGFVLYALPHSGSQELVAWLNQAADVLCHGEVFRSGTIEADQDVLERLGMRRGDVERRDHDRVAFLQRLRSRSPRRVVGFRFAPDHVRRDLDLQRQVLDDPSWRKVFFVPNPVQVYTTAQRARASDTPGGAEAPLQFSAEGFDATLQALERLEQLHERQAAEQPGAVFRLTHECLSQPARLADLLAFVGSAGAPAALARDPVPVKRQRPEAAFGNWPQFEAHLRRRGRPADAVTH